MSARPRRWRAPRALLAAAALLALGALAASSVARVAQNEQGVVLRFGRAARRCPAGIHAKLPWPIERLVRVQATEVRSLAIGIPAGASADVGDASASAQWLTGDANIVELELLVQYTVADPVRYLFGVEPGARGDGAVRLAAEAAVSGLVAQSSIDDLLGSGKSALALAARAAIQAMLDELAAGVQLVSVNIARAAPPEQVIGAFNDVTAAQSDQERDVNRADGFRRDLLPSERARANRLVGEALQDEDRLVNEARGRAQSFLALVAELEHAPPGALRRIWLERLAAILARTDKKIVPAGEATRLRVVD